MSNFSESLAGWFKKIHVFLSGQNIPDYVFLALFLIIILWLFGANILSIFGDQYSTEGTILLRMLALSTIPLIGVSIYITIKRVEKRTREIIVVNGIIATLTLGITYILSPTYGIVSAGIGWILALCTALLFIACLSIHKKIKDMRNHI